MFYIFLLHTNDSVYETTSQQSIDFDVHELFNDGDISYSINLIKVIKKTLKFFYSDILRTLFIIPQIGEIKAKVEVFVKKSHALQVSCGILTLNIKSFIIL